MTTTARTLLALLVLSSLSACTGDTYDAQVADNAICSDGDCFQAEAQDFDGEAAVLETQGAVWQAAVEINNGDGADFANRNLSIDIASVKDSRCPPGRTCVWAGEITVELDVVFGDTKATVYASDSEPARVDGLKIEVLEATPHRGLRVKGDALRVSLLLSEYELPLRSNLRPTLTAAVAAAQPTVRPTDDPTNPFATVPMGSINY